MIERPPRMAPDAREDTPSGASLEHAEQVSQESIEAEQVQEGAQAEAQQVRERLAAANAAPKATSNAAPKAPAAHHHEKEGILKGGGKNLLALLGLFGKWIWDALKRAPEMAGKGGGGEKKGGGGGGHH